MKETLYDYCQKMNRENILTEWDAAKNAPLSTHDVGRGSHRAVWWKCGKGHRWQAQIDSRVQGSGCPYCAGRAVQAGDNDLQTCYPAVAKEWDTEKNGELTPKDVTPGSRKSVWWRCKKGHSWQTKIYLRAQGSGCPYCAGKAVRAGENDLQSCFPDIAAQWDAEKNAPLLPSEVTSYSNKTAWWCCPRGHSYHMRISHRTASQSGCPYCAGTKVLQGFNDLATAYPKLAAEWDTARNGGLFPTQVSAGSPKDVWWRCSQGHEWHAKIQSRTGIGCGCPYCTNRRVLQGFNDLATTHPLLAAEWDLKKNFPLTPQQVVAGSSRKIWWLCGKGHSYQSSISSRTNKNSGCPLCSMKQVQSGVNDLSTRFPSLAAEWDREKNGTQTPEGMTCASHYRAWWRCPQGHSYQAAVVNRVYSGTNCPYCAGKKALAGFNDLASQRPELAAQWHPTLNGTLTPEQVTLGSGKNVWWRCQDGHIWRTAVFNRVNGSGCPVCSGRVSEKRQAYYKLLETGVLADNTQP